MVTVYIFKYFHRFCLKIHRTFFWVFSVIIHKIKHHFEKKIFNLAFTHFSCSTPVSISIQILKIKKDHILLNWTQYTKIKLLYFSPTFKVEKKAVLLFFWAKLSDIWPFLCLITFNFSNTNLENEKRTTKIFFNATTIFLT